MENKYLGLDGKDIPRSEIPYSGNLQDMDRLKNKYGEEIIYLKEKDSFQLISDNPSTTFLRENGLTEWKRDSYLVGEPVLENKYFTPEIEDIRVGYECEQLHTYIDGLGTKSEKVVETWYPTIVEHIHNHKHPKLKNPVYRVPYLSKEQIEAEGWNTDKIHPGYIKEIDKYSYYSLTLNENNQIVISKSFIEGWAWQWTPFYSGECKCINDFRLIMKLLCIK